MNQFGKKVRNKDVASKAASKRLNYNSHSSTPCHETLILQRSPCYFLCRRRSGRFAGGQRIRQHFLRRSFDLGIQVPIQPQLSKFRIDPTLDLMAILYNWGQAKGLKWICKRYGIKNPLPDLDGSQVVNMDPETLRKYAGNDVFLVVELYKRMCGVYLPAMNSYQPAFYNR